MLCELCNPLSIVLTCRRVIFENVTEGRKSLFSRISADTCGLGLGRALSNDRLLLAAAMPVFAPILQTVTAVNIAFIRALNPHVKMDDKRDFTKEAKLLLNAILVNTLILSNLS